MFVRNKVSALGFRIGVVLVGDNDNDNVLPRDPLSLQWMSLPESASLSESSPPYYSPTRILTPLYFQSKQNPLESLLKFLRSITALCLDSESTRTSLPDSLQVRDTNRVYFFVSVIDFYEERVCLENLCCVFLIVTIDLPFLPPGISTLVYYMVTLNLYLG